MHRRLAARYDVRQAGLGSLVSFDMLNLPVFSDVDPAVRHHLAERDRISGFDEVLAGLTEAEARHEA